MALIADRIIAAEIDRSARTIDRWDRGEKGTPAGWPKAIYLNRRKYRDADAFAAFLRGLGGKPATRSED